MTTPPETPAALVTLADAKAHLNIPTDDTSHDTELQGFIDAAEDQVTYWAGPIAAKSYTEVRDGGSPIIMLDNPPIISVDSVTEYWGLTAYALTSQPPGSTTSNFGYSLDDPASGKLVRRDSTGSPVRFSGGKNSVVIAYTAGLATVPASVRMAVLEDIRGLYNPSQQAGRPQFGGGGPTNDDNWGAGPIRQFPRLAALLDGPSRTQTVA